VTAPFSPASIASSARKFRSTGKLCSVLGPLVVVLFSSSAGAQTAAQTDHVTAPASDPELENLPAYHHSIFAWEHAVTAQTLGIGDTPQSSNPTYDMGLSAKTRYYLLDDTPAGKHFSLRLDAGLYREFTNNDSTTKRGEWSFSDVELASVYARRFRGPADTDGTLWEVRPLTLTLPTSKLSYSSGRFFAPGVLLGLIHATPLLRGKVAPEILSLVRLAVGYKRWFARATVPTNESLERVRLTPEGQSLPGDSLSGASLVRDQLELTARVRLDFGEDVFWTTDFAVAPSWKYPVQNDVRLCGVVLTGCTDVRVSPDDSRYVVQTQFNTEVSVRIAKGFSVELGYGNAAGQIGTDGRRRSFFYSPGATFLASVSFMPHELASSQKAIAKRDSPPSL
jgi:hypothetical protein